MEPTLAIIHTTVATVDPLKALAAELLPDHTVINFVDDSILPQLARNNGDVGAVSERLISYARFAEQAGANAILSACSSVGEVAGQMRAHVAIPVVRIDEPMAEQAVRQGTTIGVAATLQTTLNPTMRLVEQKAQECGVAVEITPLLAGGAYQKLMAGDKAGHDADLAAVLGKLAAQVDVVVLAQASMARVVPSLPTDEQRKCLTSPRLGMERVQAMLEDQAT